LKFSEIANRLTGISTPLVGVSWQPTDLEVSAARRVIAFLEDRRVLYAPDSLEVPSHCVESVLEIRRFLSGELGKLETGSEFAASLRAQTCHSGTLSPTPLGPPIILFSRQVTNTLALMSQNSPRDQPYSTTILQGTSQSTHPRRTLRTRLL
jgi:hypothetical protein